MIRSKNAPSATVVASSIQEGKLKKALRLLNLFYKQEGHSAYLQDAKDKLKGKAKAYPLASKSLSQAFDFACSLRQRQGKLTKEIIKTITKLGVPVLASADGSKAKAKATNPAQSKALDIIASLGVKASVIDGAYVLIHKGIIVKKADAQGAIMAAYKLTAKKGK